MRLTGVVFIFAALACGHSSTGAAELSPKEIAAARKLNLVKCSKCHKIYEPKDYAIAGWQEWTTKMARKAKLKPDQAGLLNRYFELQREGTVPSDRRDRK